jgi:hypothetical protein
VNDSSIVIHALTLDKAIEVAKSAMAINLDCHRIVLRNGRNLSDPIVWDSSAKPHHKINAPMIVPANTPGKYVAWGHKENGEQIRTSHIVKIDIEAGTIETKNSVYEII